MTLFCFLLACPNAETTVTMEQRDFTSANTPKQTDADIIPVSKHEIQGNSKLQATQHGTGRTTPAPSGLTTDVTSDFDSMFAESPGAQTVVR